MVELEHGFKSHLETSLKKLTMELAIFQSLKIAFLDQ
jgi:hypothetical protein